MVSKPGGEMQNLDMGRLLRMALFVGFGTFLWTLFIGPPGLIALALLNGLGWLIFKPWTKGKTRPPRR